MVRFAFQTGVRLVFSVFGVRYPSFRPIIARVGAIGAGPVGVGVPDGMLRVLSFSDRTRERTGLASRVFPWTP
jgi:hypothetical protein